MSEPAISTAQAPQAPQVEQAPQPVPQPAPQPAPTPSPAQPEPSPTQAVGGFQQNQGTAAQAQNVQTTAEPAPQMSAQQGQQQTQQQGQGQQQEPVPEGDIIGASANQQEPSTQAQAQDDDAVPEHYEPFYETADGAPAEAGKTFNFQLGEIARAQGWSQKKAKETFDQMGQALSSFQAAQIAQWKRETLADPELGGANWQRTQSLANRAFNEFLTDSERAIFKKNGAINQKDVVRLLARIGERITPDPNPAGLQNGNPNSTAKPKSLRDLYFRYDNN